MRFLIVDDHSTYGALLATLFRTKKHTAFTVAPKAEEVLNWLRENVCHAVILDIDMPDMDGITMLKERIRPEFPDLPVTFFTSHQYEPEQMERCRMAGGNGYCSKENPEEIVSQAVEIAQAQFELV